MINPATAFSVLVVNTWGAAVLAQPAALVKAADKALAETKSVAYDATLVATAKPGEPTVTTAYEVMMKRSAEERGVGWKLYIGSKAAGKEEPTPRLYLAFDGFAGRSLREAEKTVYEKNAKDAAGLESFLVHQNARDVLIWNLVARQSFADSKLAKSITGGGTTLVEGEKCDVLLVPDESGRVTKYSLSATDHFPRRIEVIDPPESSKPKAEPRVVSSLTLGNIRRNVPIAENTFIVDVPDEYMVKAVKDAPKSGPAAGKAPPVRPRTDNGLLAPGTLAPSWSLKDGDGKPVTSTEFAGKVVVLDFWGSWCPPCRAAMPSVQRIHEKYKDQGVVVLGMNFEREASADPAKFMTDNKITYRLVRGAETIADRFKVPGWPTFYVIGRDGEIVWGDVGFNKAEEDRHVKAMSDAIEKALKAGV
ncbi:MAG: Thiol-disulfide oxidoreductase ResA [Phycisphaerales bacterium]|nr:Thiol-disulfide oxidoreductase ResA [Phycisphaerales bacterium]